VILPYSPTGQGNKEWKMDSDHSLTSEGWASWINMILGVWLIISPWVVGFASRPTALWNTLILGVVILIAGLYASRTRSAGPSWWNVVFGIWLIISPFILGYRSLEAATADDVVLGIAVGILGLLAGAAKAATGRRSAA
jgi:hypothetical protein